MEINELINLLKDEKEQNDVKKDLTKIYEYKNFLLQNNQSNSEINSFIIDIVNKYRSKIEVKDFYKSSTGDQLSYSSYDNLCVLEKMIYNFIIRKAVLSNEK